MMSFRHLRYFIVISEEKSFVSAAKRLNTVQSSLSQQMKDLEDYIGVELYERGKRVITLTPAGDVFLEEAKKTLAEADKTFQIAKSLNKKNKNILRVGVLIGVEVKLPKNILENLSGEAYWESIEIISGTGPELIESLNKGAIDISFTRSDLNTIDVSSIKYIEEDLIFIHPASHYLYRFPYIPIKELNNIDLIMPSSVYAPELNKRIKEFLSKYNVNYNVVIEADNAFSSMSYVNMGLGCTILPDYISSICTENSIPKKFFNINPSIALYINYRKNQKMEFINSLIEYIKKERSL
ncbi:MULTISPECIES: LysR family transcriptional regulator [Acinetobacter calcoaceticus/baumannii complex]|uniref:LysR family transcriptional regulator n=1 Tax=Acinetobacter calcoaceticus/baumannii complex TaxID=909768 RepID=UPI0029412B48|nr:LysR family transcriptional regulator [Acinetobacter baumannii]MDV4328454.1 LysR family transcriptional regulator [Acinetobacter baumannii]MDV4331780.1 LysR family transcriptional regulator [Acinetobacter baumannii]